MTHTVNQLHHHLHLHLNNQISIDDPWATPSLPLDNQFLSIQPSSTSLHSSNHLPLSSNSLPQSIQPLIRSQSTSASHPLKPDIPSPLPSNNFIPNPLHPLSDATRPALKRLTADHPPTGSSSSSFWLPRQSSPRPLSPKGKHPALLPTPLADNPICFKGDRHVLLHQVSKHDTLPGIALSYGISLSALRKANGLWPSDPLSLRQSLRIPLEQCNLPPAKQIAIGVGTEQGVLWDDSSRSSGSPSPAVPGAGASLPTWAGSRESSERGPSEDSASGARLSARHRENDDPGPSTLRQRAPPARSRRTPEAPRRPQTEPLQLAGLALVDSPEISPGLEKKRLVQRAFSGTQRPLLGQDCDDIPPPPQMTTTTMGSKWTTVRPGKPPPLSKQLKFLEDTTTGTTNKLGLALQQALDGLFAPGPATQTQSSSSPANGSGKLVELDQIDASNQRRSPGGSIWEVWNEVVGGGVSGSKKKMSGSRKNTESVNSKNGLDDGHGWIDGDDDEVMSSSCNKNHQH